MVLLKLNFDNLSVKYGFQKSKPSIHIQNCMIFLSTFYSRHYSGPDIIQDMKIKLNEKVLFVGATGYAKKLN